MNVLHFTLSPVQGFVAQARRTRDLWSGSFLLSYLAGHAMKVVIEEGGKIVFPEVGTKENPIDPLLAAIMKSPLPENPEPGIGSLPNRFKAQVPEDFDGKACERAVQDAWERIAGVIWKQYVGRIEDFGNDTKKIWDRQVRGFWEMSWVIGLDPGDGTDNAWLDRRKNWRTYRPPVECGDKCTLMSNWQELSGYVRAREQKNQDNFWEKARERVGKLNLGDHERLCAIAFIKRLFPDVAEEAIGWALEAKSWPSTSYMAAVPWLRDIQEGSEDVRQLAGAYPALVREHTEGDIFGEYSTELSCLKREGFTRLDGQLYFKHAVESDKEREMSADGKRALQAHLTRLSDAVSNPPSPFYVLLLMDGDSLGRLLQTVEKSETVSAALARFTEGVDAVVREHCGKTVYAGGDDVLALLPLDRALAAATGLRQSYLEAFDHVLGVRRPPDQETGKPLKTTISAGLVYAHYHTSLRAVMQEAHRLLDEVAKDGNGRDSIAASVLTGSGRTVQWVSAWADKTTGRSVPDIVEELGESFEDQFASRFFYNARQRFEVLTSGDGNRLIDGLDAERLLVAEYLKSRERDVRREEAEKCVGQLLTVCRTRKGGEAGDARTLNLSGAMLVRFLATKGKGVER